MRGLRVWKARFRRELGVYRRVLGHPGTPRAARWLLGLAVGYALSPVDLIPDWIPLLGQLDDLVLVPLLVWLALRRVPGEVLAECRREAEAEL
ncbi:YkvA family protein [Thiohalorhabdus methylotrophus]|uniref:YkvA family protein n=1 Tax=Thiohalorhabdus methylotrophus TaxID=3242694 RepID=A0ABV4TUK8_9GAMM